MGKKKPTTDNRQLTTGYQLVPIGSIRPHPRNPRRGDMPAIAESILANGWYGAVTVQRSTGFILAGNHAYREALRLEAEQLPIHAVECSDEQALVILLADNRAADSSTYDDAELARALREVKAQTQTLAGTCWTDAELAKLTKAALAGADDEGDEERETASEEEAPAAWRLVVKCKNEKDQLGVLNELRKAGIEGRAFSV